MFKLDGKTLQYGEAFVHDGLQYPSNWLRLTSLEEKQAIGIIEVAPTVAPLFDNRFYWDDGTPKQLDDSTETVDGVEVTTAGIRADWIKKQNEIAQSLLAPSDWRVTKAAELGTTVASKWLTYRGAVRSACNTRQSEITAVKTVDALRELFFGDAQVPDSEGNLVANPGLATAWPELPS